MKVRSRRFSSRARCPQKSTVGSATYDLFAATTVVLEPVSTRSVETDIGFCFWSKCVAKIYPQSSISFCSICVGGGIIDSDLRGNIRVVQHNFSQNRVKFNTGDRIAQVLFQKKVS